MSSSLPKKSKNKNKTTFHTWSRDVSFCLKFLFAVCSALAEDNFFATSQRQLLSIDAKTGRCKRVRSFLVALSECISVRTKHSQLFAFFWSMGWWWSWPVSNDSINNMINCTHTTSSTQICSCTKKNQATHAELHTKSLQAVCRDSEHEVPQLLCPRLGHGLLQKSTW